MKMAKTTNKLKNKIAGEFRFFGLKNIIYSLLIFGLIFGLSAGVSALSGYVIDECTGSPIAGAIVVFNVSNVITDVTTTNVDGYYEIICDPCGTMRVFATGYDCFVTGSNAVCVPLCGCCNCYGCETVLNNNNCSVVNLTTDITDHSGTCINNPTNFNNKIFDCQGHTIEGTGSGYGIYLFGNSGNTIKNCVISDFHHGIFLQESSNNTLTNNDVNNNNEVGILLDSSSSNNKLISNKANDNYRGIYLYCSSSNEIIDNTASGNYFGIHLYDSLNNNLTGNTVNNNDYGIELNYGSSNNNLKGNTANSSNYYGITLYGSSNTLANNMVCSSGADDIYKHSGTSNSGDNNTCDKANGWDDADATKGCAHFCSRIGEVTFVRGNAFISGEDAHVGDNITSGDVLETGTTSYLAGSKNLVGAGSDNYLKINVLNEEGEPSGILDIGSTSEVSMHGPDISMGLFNGKIHLIKYSITTEIARKTGRTGWSIFRKARGGKNNTRGWSGGAVRGTEVVFDATIENEMQVIVLEGAVDVWTADMSKRILLGEMQGVIATPSGLGVPFPVNPDDLDEWWECSTYYRDADGDGYGNPADNFTICGAYILGYITESGDCNDNNNLIHPGAPEICNGVDDDCDGAVDEGDVCLVTYYCDDDADGYFDVNPDGTCNTFNCTPAGCSETQGNDCNDSNSLVNPGKPEICGNGIDEDCDGSDVLCGECDDSDGDGYGVCPNCNATHNCTYDGNDCNDTISSMHPTASEICDGMDDNCNGNIDEGGICPAITYYCDDDSDGYIDMNSDGTCSTFNCVPSGCRETHGNDCNDNDNSVVPVSDDLIVNRDLTLCNDVYNIAGSKANGVLIITASDITLNCNGATLSGTGSSSGIYLNNRSNVTVENCNVINYSYGVYLYSSSNNTLVNNAVNSNTKKGIFLSSSSNNSMRNNTVNNNDYYGIDLHISSNHNILVNNTANNNIWGIYSSSSSNNTFNKNTACTNLISDVYSHNLDTGNTGDNNTCDTGNWNDSGAKGCTYVCPGYRITNMSDTENLSVEVINTGLDPTIVGQSDVQDVRINVNETPVFDVPVNFTDSDPDFSNVTVSSNDTEKGMVVIHFTNETKAHKAGPKTIYVHVVSKSGWVCVSSTATNITCMEKELSGGCSNGDWVKPPEVQINGGQYYMINSTLTNEVNGTGAGENGNANLTTWDEIEYWGVKYVNDTVIFYASYINSTSGGSITGGCNITFDDGANGTMDYNTGTGTYNYSKSFSTPGVHEWNVTCYNSTYGPVSAKDTVEVSAAPTCGCDNGTYIHTCGKTIYESCNLTCDLNSIGTCFKIGANDIAINGAGYSITGNTAGNGIEIIGRNNVTINKLNVYNFSIGIYLWDSSNNTLTNNTINDNQYGIRLHYSSDNNTLTGNTANSNNWWGILISNSNNNILTGNIFNDNTLNGIRLYNSNNNTLQGNEISNNDIGIYSENSNTTINRNIVCGNVNVDFNSSDWLSSSGDNNTCGTTHNWNDTGTTGCTHSCFPQIDWLKSQQDLHSTGIVDSYEGDGTNNAYTYDQALAIIAFTTENETNRAKNILDRFNLSQNSDGSWYQCYSANDAGVCAYNKWTGDISWLIMAINYYEAYTGDDNYSYMAINALNFLETLRDTNPANESYGALVMSPGSTAYSTENNYDAYSAYYYRGILSKNYSFIEKANLIKDYLITEMWSNSSESNNLNPHPDVFWVGYNDFGYYTDPQSWGVLALGAYGLDGENFTRALEWLYLYGYGYNSTRHNQTYNNNTEIDGFDFWTKPVKNSTWLEGTEGVAAAYYSIGDNEKGDYFHNQTRKVISDNGGVIYSFSETNASDIGYPDNFRYNSIASTAWYYLNEKKINPFKLNLTLNVFCDTNDNCSDNQTCNSSTHSCQNLNCPEGDYPFNHTCKANETYCPIHTNCSDNQTCNTTTHSCRNLNCPEGDYPENHTCEENSTYCPIHTTCPSNEICNTTSHECQSLNCSANHEPFNHQCYHECDLNYDGIHVHDHNDLMTTYKCFLGVKNCNNHYQNWNSIKQEYECFAGNFN